MVTTEQLKLFRDLFAGVNEETKQIIFMCMDDMMDENPNEAQEQEGLEYLKYMAGVVMFTDLRDGNMEELDRLLNNCGPKQICFNFDAKQLFDEMLEQYKNTDQLFDASVLDKMFYYVMKTKSHLPSFETAFDEDIALEETIKDETTKANLEAIKFLVENSKVLRGYGGVYNKLDQMRQCGNTVDAKTLADFICSQPAILNEIKKADIIGETYGIGTFEENLFIVADEHNTLEDVEAGLAQVKQAVGSSERE